MRKTALLLFTMIGLGVAAYFVLPLTPIPDYVKSVIDRASMMFGQ
ncbi:MULTISPECIES: hypothetical protein [Thalassospira]|uniref:Uncharacterized protein n=1 Tax=Thalassospira aquimaris TaxID=3037796 RepID=A0ABT6G7Q4_9PROT|nr:MULTISPECIES: hypothetical protein [Thalassospira]MDG4718087.1 hypothetical protein [Thalassospira sp. FZY0004]